MESFSYGTSESLKGELQAWLASFAPLVMPGPTPTEGEVMRRLGLVLDLKKTGSSLKMRVGEIVHTEEELVDTFRRAMDQLPSLEEETRKLLGTIKPGDPRGISDIDALRDRLIDRESRQEIGATSYPIPDRIFDVVASPCQPALAAAQGVVGLGVLAFTLVHATFMIGGMAKAFGPIALFLLFFYGIFWAAVAGMFSSAFKAGAEERVQLDGRNLTITRTLGPIKSTKTLELLATTKPRIATPTMVISTRNGQMPQEAILLTDVNGKEIAIGMGMTRERKEDLRDRIATYLQAYAS